VGTAGPTGPTGSSGSGGTCIAAPNQEEKGAWSATINVANGGQQEQVQAAISLACEANEKVEKTKVHFLTEKQVSEPGSVPQCLGNGNAPIAEAGNLCVYNSAIGQQGLLESEWNNASFHQISDTTGIANPKAKIGFLVIFRTNEYTEGAPTTAIKAANLNAAGAWAFTEKK
jgi:hypothetical protein